MPKLSDKQVVNFLNAASPGSCLAVQLAQDHLKEGKSIKELFTKHSSPFGITDEAVYGHYIKAHKLSEKRYQIEFGCHAGPLAGDGGTWIVEFDKDDKVVSCDQVGRWIS
ncbi:MAG: hypothetical protein TR69_WS6001000044 [candidate division WS6 bacterium OLB20]|uniref:Uncharacterized protein n=1 Tax=candidate division WS6 bacterium OLB20 TaxID=1617426 RepID=A0A136M126_9BACT|nr:MAG: hypothetical protein TR69_WS6001000044 [candidate division WS6 bacterium OLB20]